MFRLPLLLLSLLLSAPIAAATADEDHGRARAAREAGRIVALETIVAAAERHTGGGVILDVELEDEGRYGGRWIYEVKALAADGRIVKLEYDAATGALLREKHRRKR